MLSRPLPVKDAPKLANPIFGNRLYLIFPSLVDLKTWWNPRHDEALNYQAGPDQIIEIWHVKAIWNANKLRKAI